MTEDEQETIEQLESWRRFIENNKEKVNKADEIEFYLRTALNLIQRQEREINSNTKRIILTIEHKK
ncbi:MAG: hypothetical protein HFJ26_01725 [Clostridia bacterium]|nr:hypothetical protein [Clostridia bacterium]